MASEQTVAIPSTGTVPNVPTSCVNARLKAAASRQVPSICPNCGANLDYDGGLHCDCCGVWFERPKKCIGDVVADVGTARKGYMPDEETRRQAWRR